VPPVVFIPVNKDYRNIQSTSIDEPLDSEERRNFLQSFPANDYRDLPLLKFDQPKTLNFGTNFNTYFLCHLHLIDFWQRHYVFALSVCRVRSFVRPFILTDLVTTISHGHLEPYR